MTGKGKNITQEDIILAPPVALGTILFSLVEPEPDQAVSFARWYERDHFFAGCMSGADFFSGKRFVATADLKRRRGGSGLDGTAPLKAGSFLNLYWILNGRREPALSWSVDQVRRLARQNRMGPPTRSISTGFYEYIAGQFSEFEAIAPELALEYPFRFVRAMLIDMSQGADEKAFRSAIEQYLQKECVTPRSMSLWFRPLQLPANAPKIAARVSRDELERRWLILTFSDANMLSQGSGDADALGQILSETGLGALRLAAPFRPILPGVDDYTDRL